MFRILTPARILRLGWLLLAGWLALWPAAEARRADLRLGAAQFAQTAKFEKMAQFAQMAPAADVAGPAGGCCRAAKPAGEDACCRGRSETPARPASCPEGGTPRCIQCQTTGGAALFAHSLAVPEPERAVLGAIFLGDHVAVSRDLRPPVPPPRTDVLTRT
jgi:hypothetical protein